MMRMEMMKMTMIMKNSDELLIYGCDVDSEYDKNDVDGDDSSDE